MAVLDLDVAPARQEGHVGSRAGPADDWRFLVPAHLLADGSAADPLAGSRPRVVLTGHTSDLATAVAGVRPDGAVVIRTAAPRVRTPWRIRRLHARLRRHGLADPRTYWLAPDADTCSHIVDISDRASIVIMLRRWHGVRWGRLRSVVARLLVTLGLLPVIARDLVTVAYASAGDGDGARALPFPAVLAPQQASVTIGGTRHRASAHAVLLTPRFPTSRHVIALVGDGSARTVTRVVKAARDLDAAGALSREAAALAQLRRLAPLLTDRVPIVLEHQPGLPVPRLAESALPNNPLHPAAVRARPLQALRLAREFVDLLPVVATGSGDDWHPRLVERPLRRLATTMRLVAPEVADLVSRTLRVTGSLADHTLPLVFEHGDLSHPNLLLVAPGRLGAVDWEGAEPAGVVGHDFAFVLQYLAEAEHRATTVDAQVRAFEHAFADPGAAARSAFADHLRSRDVDPRLAPSLLVCCWARTAAGRYSRLLGAAHARGGSALDAAPLLQASRELALWRRALALAVGAQG